MDLQALKSRRYDINKLVSAAQEAGGGEKGDRNSVKMSTPYLPSAPN